MKPMAVAAWSLLTPFGDGDQTIEALFEQRSAFSVWKTPWKLRNACAAVIPERPADLADDGKWQRHMATHVGRRVLESAPSDLLRKPDRCAFFFATSYGHLLDVAEGESVSAWAKDCVLDLNFKNDPIVVGSGCSSGADALGVAAAMLDCGAIDAAVVIAADIVTSAKQLGHSALGTMTTGRQMPFDVNRSGILLGEASAAVVLVRSADFPAFDAQLLGVGASNDAFGVTAPDPSGLSIRLALDRALKSAALKYEDLALYFAHGTGTLLNDEVEAKVIEKVFAENDLLTVVGTKGALGHSVGACGLVEFILLLQMLKRGLAPATVGLVDPIDGVSKRFPGEEGRRLFGHCGVSVTLGFGGFNTALIGRA